MIIEHDLSPKGDREIKTWIAGHQRLTAAEIFPTVAQGFAWASEASESAHGQAASR